MEWNQHGKPRNVTGQQTSRGAGDTKRDNEQTKHGIDQINRSQTSDRITVFDQKRADGGSSEPHRETQADRKEASRQRPQGRLKNE